MNRWQELQRWFLALEPRERRVLLGGALLLVAALLYTGLLGPYLHARARLAAEVRTQQALLAWMQPAAVRLRALGGRAPQALPGNSLLDAVNRTIGDPALGGASHQVRQEPDGTVRVQFDNVAFDGLLRWLQGLQRQYGVTVTEMTVARNADPGMVSASLGLKAPQV